ncbi:sensor domain-containing diguanylate cyclase [Aquibium microcysteis]|uniref:GGDEF domain-containing protein n=1 Tax=Aquibium microcysteis TaxID=675281 RepID=UPI00165D262D|nr:GGDEF domain-containing protein [Aquibium microcysteis]
MFERRLAVLFGVFTSIVTAAAALLLTGAAWPAAWIVAEILLFAGRYRNVDRIAARPEHERHAAYARLVFLGIAWSVTFGLGQFACAASGIDLLVVMGAINTAGAVGNIASRNAPLPRLGVIVMALSGLPFGFGLYLYGAPGMLMVFVMTTLLTGGMMLVMLQNHEIMLRMINAEWTNHLAARTDRLTDLPNRIHLEERLSELCDDRLTTPDTSPFAVLCLDLDGFKAVNDQYGHAAGDALLQAVAGRIVQSIRDRDIACRVGGDEFVLLLPDTSAAEASFVAARLITAISRPYDLGIDRLVRIGVSAGSAIAEEPGEPPQSLLDRADQALYAAKAAGKGVHREGLTGNAAR